MILVKEKILKKVFPKRPKNKYFKKYDFGLLIVIGGSDFYSGSPALNALAAFRTGVGMVRILAPERAANIIASFSPNLAAYPLEGRFLQKKHLPFLLEMTKSSKLVAEDKVAVVIGGGLGRTSETQEVVLEFLKRVNLPLVIDADAIYAVAKNKEVILGKKVVFTPHVFEFFVLTGKKVENLPLKEKIKVVREEALKLNSVILLKGKPDIISDGKKIALCYAGSPYMAVGGTGDVLAGICGAFLSQKIEPFLAAKAAVYLNGRAGEVAAKNFKEGLLATDLIEAIPKVLKEV